MKSLPPPSIIKTIALCTYILRQCSSLQTTPSPIQNTLTPNELHQLAIKAGQRERGSKSYKKSWHHYRRCGTESIRYELSQLLPHPVDQAELNSLSFSLGVAADVGEMPSFESAGARSGYAMDYFCRARLLADLLIQLGNEAELTKKCHLTSIGGGPGFDYVAAALVSLFNAAGDSECIMPVHATILDYEVGWGDLVGAMNEATNAALPTENKMHCRWGGACDITKSIYHESNTNCLQNVNSTTIWTCQYCVAENAVKLRDSDYVFFRELFAAAANGASFLITETTPRLWPEFYELVLQYNADNFDSMLQISFPYMRGQQMMITKSRIKDGCSVPRVISEKDEKLLLDFEKYLQSHDDLMESGWERQRKKTLPLI
ncbi:hypothetical protein ACHAWO_011558 [Cyclotella atomus]|uniref:Uncharacterized protein n=1 Tax=Cyclotella atomus TaxID=382360 RepID=A0ABD3N4X0_9STRA